MAALGAVAISSCRFGYEELQVISSGGGGVATTGGDAAPRPASSGASGEGPAQGDGGAGTTNEGGAAGAVAVGGMNETTGGTASGTGGGDVAGSSTGGSDIGGSSTGGSDIGGSSTGGSDIGGNGGSTGGGPGLCVADAICSCEVFQGHEYRFCRVLATRDAGAIACRSFNMGLVRVDSAEENAWLFQQFKSHAMFIGGGDPIVLLGGNDIQVEGAWRWEDGTLFWDGGPVDDRYTNFASPPKMGVSDCLGMSSATDKWLDRACNSGNATVACESP